jgi:hypothetical protein
VVSRKVNSTISYQYYLSLVYVEATLSNDYIYKTFYTYLVSVTFLVMAQKGPKHVAHNSM